MKKKVRITLKIESEKGIEEYPFEIRNLDRLIDMIFEEGGVKRNNEVMLDIVMNSSEGHLVAWALDYLTTTLKKSELEELYQRFYKNTDVQYAIIAYCGRKKKVAMLKKIATKGVNADVRREAQLYLKDFKQS